MKRLHCEKVAWHVYARGARRLELFRNERDFSEFIRILAFGLRISGCDLWAFALMSNHYHLVLHGDSEQLTACMRRIGCMYSHYHNKRYGLSGHAFDGPYQAWRQRSAVLTLRTLAYVFYNPVKGGLSLTPESYRWSGCRSFLGMPGGPLAIDPAPALAAVNPDPAKAWTRFYEAMRAEARRPPKKHPNRLTMVEVHAEHFTCLLEHAQGQGVDRAGEPPVTIAIYWARQCGIVPRAIALALGRRSSEVVKTAMRHLRKRFAKEPGLEERLAPP